MRPSFVLPVLALGLWLALGVSCDHALGSLGGSLAFRMGKLDPPGRRMLVTDGSKLRKAPTEMRRLKQDSPEREVLDLAVEELDGSWEGLTKPVILFESLFPVCPEESSSCAKDMPIKFTLIISDGKDFAYRSEKDESATCATPLISEAVEGTVTSYENNRLLLSYTRDGLQFDFPGADALREVYGEEQTACLNMEVYEEKGKVKADLKVSVSFSGTFEEFQAYLKKSTSGFSVCIDETEDCIYDIADLSNVVVQTTQLATLECVDGKCLNLLGYK